MINEELVLYFNNEHTKSDALCNIAGLISYYNMTKGDKNEYL